MGGHILVPYTEARWKATVRNGDIDRARMREIPGAGIDSDTGRPHIMQANASINAQAMLAEANAKGVPLRLIYSYRPLSVQWEKWWDYKLHDGNVAAPPGTSNHGWGIAIDIASYPSAVAWMRNNARRFGFYERVPGEPWHWEYEGGGVGEKWLEDWEDEMAFMKWHDGVERFKQGRNEPANPGPEKQGYLDAQFFSNHPKPDQHEHRFDESTEPASVDGHQHVVKGKTGPKV